MSDLPQSVTLEISTRSVLRIIAILAAIVFAWLISDILFSFFVAIILASAINPWVAKLQAMGIPRGVSVIATYFLALAVIALAVALIIPPLTSEVSQLVKDFPEKYQGSIDFFASLKSYLDANGLGANVQNALQGAEEGLTKITGGFFGAVSGFFGGLFGFLIIAVLAFYFSTSEAAIRKLLTRVIPPHAQERWFGLIDRAQEKIGLWFRGQIILSFAIFIMSFVGLSLLGVKYALALAFLAGLLEIVPVIGPIISAVPAIFLTLLYSPPKALLVLVLFIFIQQVENNFLVPKVMQKTVGLHPIVVILSMLIGAKLGGILGALVAIPIATAADVFLSDIYVKYKKNETITEEKPLPPTGAS